MQVANPSSLRCAINEASQTLIRHNRRSNLRALVFQHPTCPNDLPKRPGPAQPIFTSLTASAVPGPLLAAAAHAQSARGAASRTPRPVGRAPCGREAQGHGHGALHMRLCVENTLTPLASTTLGCQCLQMPCSCYHFVVLMAIKQEPMQLGRVPVAICVG